MSKHNRFFTSFVSSMFARGAHASIALRCIHRDNEYRLDVLEALAAAKREDIAKFGKALAFLIDEQRRNHWVANRAEREALIRNWHGPA